VDALKEPLGPYAWRLWAATWTPGEPGNAELVVRAIDGQGQVQTSAAAPPLPDGSSGWHRRRVAVRGCLRGQDARRLAPVCLLGPRRSYPLACSRAQLTAAAVCASLTRSAIVHTVVTISAGSLRT